MGVNFEPKKGRDPIYNTRVLLEEVLQRPAQLAMDDKKLGAALAELQAELAPQTGRTSLTRESGSRDEYQSGREQADQPWAPPGMSG